MPNIVADNIDTLRGLERERLLERVCLEAAALRRTPTRITGQELEVALRRVNLRIADPARELTLDEVTEHAQRSGWLAPGIDDATTSTPADGIEWGDATR